MTEFDKAFKTEAILQLDEDICYLSEHWNIPGMEADDIAQELRLFLWKKLDGYDPARSSIRTYADRIMKNKLRNMYRDAGRKPLNNSFMYGTLDTELEVFCKSWIKNHTKRQSFH
jgi:RNA polymerase sigma factor (sigma-70 family)